MRIPAALLAAAALVVGVGAAPAAASEGSVPVEVAAFAAAPDGLIAGLEDFFGPGADGTGIDFDDTTVIGAVDRVFTFSPDWLAGTKTDAPVVLANQWTVPVSVGDKPLGVAVIWINPGTVRPQLADFIADPAFATALPDVPADAWLVADQPRAAWLVLAGTALTPLVVGESGIVASTELDAYRATVTAAEEEPAPDEELNLGSVLSIATIAGVALLVVLVLLVLALVRRRRARDAGEAAEPAPEPEAPAATFASPENPAEGRALVAAERRMGPKVRKSAKPLAAEKPEPAAARAAKPKPKAAEKPEPAPAEPEPVTPDES